MSKKPDERKWIEELIGKLLDINIDFVAVRDKKTKSRAVKLRRKLQELDIIKDDFRKFTFKMLDDLENPKPS